MATTLLTSPRSRRVALIERATSPASRVDRAAKVIRGVLVCGLNSRNDVSTVGIDGSGTYSYSAEALRAAAPLYEAAPVNLDHPAFEFDEDGRRRVVSQQKTAQRFGELRNVRFVDGRGLVADLHYLSAHPLAEMIVEMAERMPGNLAMSHQATGDIRRQNDGRYVVGAITDVHSVDLIAEKPGTTTSLFESQHGGKTTMPTTLKDTRAADRAESLSYFTRTVNRAARRRLLMESALSPEPCAKRKRVLEMIRAEDPALHAEITGKRKALTVEQANEVTPEEMNDLKSGGGMQSRGEVILRRLWQVLAKADNDAEAFVPAAIALLKTLPEAGSAGDVVKEREDVPLKPEDVPETGMIESFAAGRRLPRAKILESLREPRGGFARPGRDGRMLRRA